MRRRPRSLSPEDVRKILDRMDQYAPGKRPDLREVLAHSIAPDIEFRGEIVSLQPRIRLTRSFDEAAHTYLGYCTASTF